MSVGFDRRRAIAGFAALALSAGVTAACHHTGSSDAAAAGAEGKTEAMPDVPMLPMEVVTAKSLNVRAMPTSKGSVLGTLKKGQEVRVLETKNGWKRVQSDGAAPEGWVAGEFLKGHEATGSK
jgi:uncharacterized protein YgiM (DUF1202 family)